MKFYLVLFLSKLAQWVLSLLSHVIPVRGTNFPGVLALRLCPDFIARVGKPKTIIAVTGTNGKTTTNNLLSGVLSSCGYSVLSNLYGSNINTGIASCLLSGVTIGNRPTKDIAVLEIDERSAVRIYPYLTPDYVICTNLSRDTIMRNAHPYYIFELLDSQLPNSCTMILNGDDVISSRLKKNNKRVYYTVAQQLGDATEDLHLVNDAKVCPQCHGLLTYDYFKYDHLGHAHCPACGYESPTGDYVVTGVDSEAKTLSLSHEGTTTSYPLVSDTVFNVYNEAAVLAMTDLLVLPQEKVCTALGTVSVVDSRLRERQYGDIQVKAIMSKGLTPACNAVLEYTSSQPEEKEVVLYLEDKHELASSSERITWIFDSDFQLLEQENISRIVIAGVRRHDFYFRLLLAGVNRDKIVVVETPAQVADALSLESGESVYILTDLYSGEERDLMMSGIQKRVEARQ